MPIFYAVKHMFRSWKLFLALLIGITLASTFFAGIDIKANATAKQALDQQLRYVYVDMQASIQNFDNLTKLLTVRDTVLGVSGVVDAEIISRIWVQITIFSEDSARKEHMARITAIIHHSQVYRGWLNRPAEIGENETYIPENTVLASMVKINDIIQVNFSTYDTQISIPLNLTVKGFAQLDEKAAAIA
ncbi:MAG: hypothetical protein QMD20_02975, partial [Candidatus Bathyarchaeia archaeon]|nr:hypothetical protein [Candidatus Bathyarchaeia archaeon]